MGSIYFMLTLLVAATELRSKLRLRGANTRATERPVIGNSPEDILNIVNYEKPQPIPQYVENEGMYCRGGGCQFRVPPAATTVPPPLPIPIQYPPELREFCRGFSCPPKLGWPQEPGFNSFMLNCSHLYNDVGQGLEGSPKGRSLADVKKSFYKWCKFKFPPWFATNCEGLGDFVVMAMHARAEDAHVGDVGNICQDSFYFMKTANQATIDLRLVEMPAPPPALLTQAVKKKKLFLPSDLDDQVGPRTERGIAWAKIVAHRRSLESKGLYHQAVVSEAKTSADSSSLLSIVPDRDPVNKPDYIQHVNQEQVGAAPKSYVIAKPANSLPVEIDGPLYERCTNQFSEIMSGFAQTGAMTSVMTKDWCTWQSSVTNWVGRQAELGHPEWDFMRCRGMELLVRYALRNQLDEGLSANQVCKSVFLALGDVRWHRDMVKTAWDPAPVRGASSGKMVLDADMTDLMEKAQQYAESIFSKLRGQKDMSQELNGVKMDDSAFALHQKVEPTQAPRKLKLDDFKELDK